MLGRFSRAVPSGAALAVPETPAEVTFACMRRLLPLIFLFAAIPAIAQLNNWDPSWNATDTSLIFHDDLDYYLNAYSKQDIGEMRKQVSMWRMNFDKMIRRTIDDLREYSEGRGMEPRMHDFTLRDTDGKDYTLSANEGKIRAFMFGSITSPPARMQMERWSRLIEKYAGAEVQLFVIYGRELHPGDRKNYRKFPVPQSMEEKVAYAKQFAELGKLPVLIDGMDDATFNAYGRVPNGAYLVDKDGDLVFRGTWADARKMEHMIDTLLKWYKAGKPKNYKAM